MSSPLQWASAIKITPGPSAANIPGKGGREAFLNGGSVPQGSSRAIRSAPLGPLNGPLGKRLEQPVKGPAQVVPVFRFQGHFDLVVGIIQHRIRAQQEIGKRLEETVENSGDYPLAFLHVDDLEIERGVAKIFFDDAKALVQDLGNAGEDIDVAELHHGRVERSLAHQLRPLGNIYIF